MSKPTAVLCGIVALGVVVVLALAAGSERRVAFTLGVTPAGPVVELKPQQGVCQQPVTVPDGDAAFDRVVIGVGTANRPGPELSLRVADETTNETLASGRLARGYPDFSREPRQTIELDRTVDTHERLKICVGNVGTTSVKIYGNGDPAARTSTALRDGIPANADLSLVFERAEPRSTLSLVPAIFDRAAVWRASWIGGWFYFLLAAVVVLAVPALLVKALRDATRA